MGKTQCNIAIQIKQRKIRCAVSAPGVSKILGKKTKNTECHMSANLVISIVVFGVQNDVADVMTHAKFFFDRCTDLEFGTPQIFQFFLCLAGRPYNSVSITVLHVTGSGAL